MLNFEVIYPSGRLNESNLIISESLWLTLSINFIGVINGRLKVTQLTHYLLYDPTDAILYEYLTYPTTPQEGFVCTKVTEYISFVVARLLTGACHYTLMSAKVTLRLLDSTLSEVQLMYCVFRVLLFITMGEKTFVRSSRSDKQGDFKMGQDRRFLEKLWETGNPW